MPELRDVLLKHRGKLPNFQAAGREVAIEKGRNPDKKRGKHMQILDEWDDLAKEERLYKKMRRGKITKEEFNEQMSSK
jgi:hypothetical protein